MKPSKRVPPVDPGLQVTVGHNTSVGQVVLVFGPPDSPDMKFITLSPQNAMQLSASLQQNAEQALGRKAS